MPKISSVGLFCCDKFEETSKQKVIDLSKLKEIYFRTATGLGFLAIKEPSLNTLTYMVFIVHWAWGIILLEQNTFNTERLLQIGTLSTRMISVLISIILTSIYIFLILFGTFELFFQNPSIYFKIYFVDLFLLKNKIIDCSRKFHFNWRFLSKYDLMLVESLFEVFLWSFKRLRFQSEAKCCL